MSYIESNLIPGETILYRTRLHWIALFWPMLFAVFFGLAALGTVIAVIAAPSTSNGKGMGIGMLAFYLAAAAVLAGAGILRRGSTEMAVTNKRVLIKTGLISRKTVEMLLSKIESVGVTEPILGRLLGYGAVVVRGTGGTPEPFSRIAHPLEFRRQVQQQIESQKAT
jgi:uncharacterized membrane protein YdbT with pleckstrin-like domain